MKLLYRFEKNQTTGAMKNVDINVEDFTPTLRKGMFLSGEKRTKKEMLVRFIFFVITYGKARIFYVSRGQNPIHTSFVIPRCCKFPFLKKNDYEIGPCFTYPEYRGQGIYPAVLWNICGHLGTEETRFFMIVDEKNTASIRGIEKAGFQKYGVVKVTKFTKRYLLESVFEND